MHLYLATGLEPARDGRLAPDEDEVVSARADGVAGCARGGGRGEIADAKSIVAMLWLARMGGPEAVGGG